MENTNDSGTKRKKSHGKLKVFLVFILLVGAATGYMIYSGAWNPFKSKEISEEAKANYDNRVDYNINFALNAGMDREEFEEGGYFGPNSTYPYGFSIEDYGEEGKNGVLQVQNTVYADYNSRYGGFLSIYFMKNIDYSKEQYLGWYNGSKSKSDYNKEYVIDDNNKVYFYVNSNTKVLYTYIIKGCMNYELYGYEAANIVNSQNLVNDLGFDCTLPSLEEIQAGN